MKGFDILYEDDAVIVCRKEAGIAVETAAVGQADILSGLKRYLSAKGEAPSVFIVHRLDQPVSGLLVFAKDKRSAAALSAQASPDGKGKKMLKEYEAWIFGRMPEAQGTLRDFLKKDAKTNTSFKVSEAEGGKKAVLHYEALEELYNGQAQKLKIRLETGRHHQIRVQLSARGCPILGDMKYGTEASISFSKETEIKELKLCAAHLIFYHPTDGRKMEFFEMQEIK